MVVEVMVSGMKVGYILEEALVLLLDGVDLLLLVLDDSLLFGDESFLLLDFELNACDVPFVLLADLINVEGVGAQVDEA